MLGLPKSNCPKWSRIKEHCVEVLRAFMGCLDRKPGFLGKSHVLSCVGEDRIVATISSTAIKWAATRQGPP